MDADDFILKWQANQRNEQAASKEHFFDLCALLGVPTPNSDPTGATYAFEKGVKKSTGGAGWADVWRRGCFGWEYKSRGGDLGAAHDQLLRYAGALENPPLLIASDMDRIVVRTNWTNQVTAQEEFSLADLRIAQVRAKLAACWLDPDRWKPATTRQALTERVAAEFAELAKRLRDRGHDPQGVAHFVNRLVFCLFADDVGLLPPELFGKMLGRAARRPHEFPKLAAKLFGAMAMPNGTIDFDDILWFNGGLFDDDSALPLERDDIRLLERVAALDWAEIDPSILGTLFERGLDPDKRSQLGAHYTDAEKIEKLIDPVIRRPLRAEWEATKGAIVAAQTAAAKRTKKAAEPAGTAEFRAYLQLLRAFRVLDPACGSGNFLYLSLLALKDLEHAAMTEAEAMGLHREFYGVGPEQVLGIEINPYAAELARISVWIGDIQWARRHGFLPSQDPVLRKLDTIDCRDAVLAPDGTPAAWPKVDAIVGNPPFLGGKRMRGVLGDATTEALFAAYAGRVPAEADLVCYWFELTGRQLASGNAKRAGLVATQTIRKGVSREVIDRIVRFAPVYNAWSDEAWAVDGADVRVSLICFATETYASALLSGVAVSKIHADLTSQEADLTTARRQKENLNVCYQGITKLGPFDISGADARRWLQEPTNPNGQNNSLVLKPWLNAKDIMHKSSDTWTVDFGVSINELEASFFVSPFAHVLQSVKPIRDKARREGYRRHWWRFGEPRPGLRRALEGLDRFIVTPKVSRHRIFLYLPRGVLPEQQFYVFCRDDDVFLGILHSRFHETWTLVIASRHGVGNDPSYTPSATFETFPFPEGLTPNIPAAAYADDPRARKIAAAARDLVEKRDRWLNPPELIKIVPEVVPGFPDRILPRDAAAEKILKKRTLTNLYNTRGTPEGAWLDSLHRALDAAVAAAYGWPADLPDDEVLARLLALNHARAGN